MASLPPIKRGDTWRATFTYLDDAGDPIDLTDCMCQLQIQDKQTKGLLLDCTDYLVISPLVGEVSVDVDLPADFPVGTHQLDLQMTYSDGYVESSETMMLTILEDITRAR